jgi:hypothetical protein
MEICAKITIIYYICTVLSGKFAVCSRAHSNFMCNRKNILTI